jgi:hypothetical protein
LDGAGFERLSTWQDALARYTQLRMNSFI